MNSAVGGLSNVPSASTTTTGPPAHPFLRRKSLAGRFLGFLNVKYWRRIPFPIIILAIWGTLRWFGVQLPASSSLGLIFIVICFLTLILEFWKSGDISLGSFKLDQLLSLFATVLATSIATLLWKNGTFFTVDLFVVCVVLVDGYLSPVNSFRTALRNFQGGINAHAGDPQQE